MILVKGEGRRPSFLRVNPSGKLPVLVDGDLVLSESGGSRALLLDTGCVELGGEWSREASQAGGPTRRIDLRIFGRDEPPPCPTEVQARADAVN